MRTKMLSFLFAYVLFMLFMPNKRLSPFRRFYARLRLFLFLFLFTYVLFVIMKFFRERYKTFSIPSFTILLMRLYILMIVIIIINYLFLDGITYICVISVLTKKKLTETKWPSERLLLIYSCNFMTSSYYKHIIKYTNTGFKNLLDNLFRKTLSHKDLQVNLQCKWLFAIWNTFPLNVLQKYIINLFFPCGCLLFPQRT